MNRSKNAVRLAYILPLLTLLAVLVHAWYYFIKYPLCHVGDVYQYYLQISTGDITNWWSALYMFECRWLMKGIAWITGTPADACLAMFLLKCLTVFSLFCAIEIFVHTIVRFKPSMALLSSISICLIQICISITSLHVERSLIGRLDICGTSLLFFSVMGTLMLNACSRTGERVMILALVFVSMLHAVAFRRPFMLMVPILSLYITAVLYHKKLLSFSNILRGTIACFAFFFSVWIIEKALPRHKHTYPASIMLLSELRIASILNLETDYINGVFAPKLNKRAETNHILRADSQILIPIDTPRDWSMLLKEYTAYFKRNPLAIAEARLIQCVEFCTSDHVPYVVKKLIQLNHPYVGTDKTVYGQYRWPVNTRPLFISSFYYFCIVLWMAGTFCPIIHYCRMRRMALSAKDSALLRTELYLGFLCLASMLCYMVVVVPTADFRYRSQVLLLGLCSVVWWLAIRNGIGRSLANEIPFVKETSRERPSAAAVR